MAAFIPPIVGWPVWYYPGKGSPHRLDVDFAPREPLMATICAVNKDTGTVNLGGFDALGHPYCAFDVTLLQEGESIIEGNEHCRWA